VADREAEPGPGQPAAALGQLLQEDGGMRRLSSPYEDLWPVFVNIFSLLFSEQ